MDLSKNNKINVPNDLFERITQQKLKWRLQSWDLELMHTQHHLKVLEYQANYTVFLN